jgi:hypothetical protein
MFGKNWNSKERVYTNIVKKETLAKSKMAREFKSEGNSVLEITKKIGLSKSRIYEYLRN